MSMGKAAGGGKVAAELLKSGGDNFLEAVVRVCREQEIRLGVLQREEREREERGERRKRERGKESQLGFAHAGRQLGC